MEKLWFKRLDETEFVKYTLLEDEVEAYKYGLNKEDFIMWVMKLVNGSEVRNVYWELVKPSNKSEE